MNALVHTLVLGMVMTPVAAAPLEDDRVAPQDTRPGPPPGTYTIAPAAASIRIPFEVVEGEIRLNGRVNGRAARMLIDNGALWDELLFFGSPKVDALELKRDGVIEVQGAGAGDPILADMASGISVSFDGEGGRTVVFKDQPGVIMPYDPKKPNPWALTEGQISSALFKSFVVGFDFDEGIMTLIRPEAFVAQGMGVEIPIKPANDSGWTMPCTITLQNGRRLELDMMMDLGWDEPIAINTGQAHQIELPDGLEKTKLGSGAQGEIHGYHGSVRRLEIGSFSFDDVAATYSTVEDGGSKVDEVMVGLGIFQRFHVFFDYPGHRVFLKPNRRFNEPFVTPGKP